MARSCSTPVQSANHSRSLFPEVDLAGRQAVHRGVNCRLQVVKTRRFSRMRGLVQGLQLIISRIQRAWRRNCSTATKEPRS